MASRGRARPHLVRVSPERFISAKLKFQGNIAAIAIAVSFLVMILAVTVSSGFRHSIREGVAAMTGDIRIYPAQSVGSDQPWIPRHLEAEQAILAIPGVRSLEPVVSRGGIVKNGDVIHGVNIKGTQRADSALCVSIPARLREITGVGPGEEMTTYFVGERIRVRKFRVTGVHRDILENDDNLVVRANLADVQRLNGWDSTRVSSLEVMLEEPYRTPGAEEAVSRRIGELLSLSSDDAPYGISVQSSVRAYPQVFDWLDLLDFNVLFILILMTVVAGFNMISGLLIMLLRNIPTIGVLKTMGMDNRGVGRVFLHVGSSVVLKGMAVGNALALLFCLVQGVFHLIPLDAANYFVSYVPVHVDIVFILLADATAYAGIMLLLLIPTLFISRVDPAKTVKVN